LPEVAGGGREGFAIYLLNSALLSRDKTTRGRNLDYPNITIAATAVAALLVSIYQHMRVTKMPDKIKAEIAADALKAAALMLADSVLAAAKIKADAVVAADKILADARA